MNGNTPKEEWIIIAYMAMVAISSWFIWDEGKEDAIYYVLLNIWIGQMLILTALARRDTR